MTVLETGERLELRQEEGELCEGEECEGGLDLHVLYHLLSLEPEVLKRFGSTAVLARRLTIVAAPGGEIALRDPGGRAMACRGELLEALLGPVEHLRRRVEALLLEERAAEDELGVADLVDELDAVA